MRRNRKRITRLLGCCQELDRLRHLRFAVEGPCASSFFELTCRVFSVRLLLYLLLEFSDELLRVDGAVVLVALKILLAD